MTVFETILVMLLIPLYGIVFYIAGRIDLVNRVVEMFKEFEEMMKDVDDEEDEE